MKKERRVFFISGYDPSSSAGIFHDVIGARYTSTPFFAIPTALTHQTYYRIDRITWFNLDLLLQQLNTGLKDYSPSSIKFGIIKSYRWITVILENIKRNITNSISVVIDPIIKSTTSFPFHTVKPDILSIGYDKNKYDIILTPNVDEAKILGEDENFEIAASKLSTKFKVIVKGIRKNEYEITDFLFIDGKKQKEVSKRYLKEVRIRGRGCIFASLLACYLSRDYDIYMAMEKASIDTTEILRTYSLKHCI